MKRSSTDFCVFVGCCRKDLFLAKVLCASVRFFCAEVPIVLVKDGRFSSKQLHCLGNIHELDPLNVAKEFRDLSGWGLPKLMCFFQSYSERFLYLDADTLLLNDPFQLPFSEYDFYVDEYTDRDLPSDIDQGTWMKRVVFDKEKIRAFDPDFDPDRIVPFNTGQLFGRRWLLSVEDTLRCIEEWKTASGLFSCADQGILNYLLNRGGQRGEFSLGRGKFKIGAGYESIEEFPGLSLDRVLAGEYVFRHVIHWAGVKSNYIESLPFSELLEGFEKVYYSRLPSWARASDRLWRFSRIGLGGFRRRMSSVIKNIR